MKDITICSVVCNDNNTQLFDLMIKSIQKYTNIEKKFIICDNGGNSLDKYSNLSNFAIVHNKSKSKGSLQHGESINKIIELSKTKYTAIVESDCVVLNNEWNNLGSYKMMAAKKDKGLYHACFIVAETDILSAIDFRPGNENKTNRSYKSHEDVGWRINTKIKTEDVKIIEFVDCKSNKGKLFDGKFQSDEFWYNNKIIAAHFGRGSNLHGKAARKGFLPNKEQLEAWKKIAEREIK